MSAAHKLRAWTSKASALLGPGPADWQRARGGAARRARTTRRAAVRAGAGALCRRPSAAAPAPRSRLAMAVGRRGRRAGRAARPGAAGDGVQPRPAATATTATRCARRWRRAERLISPTRFHNSVHNAPAGYWHIAAQRDAAIDQPVAPTTPASAPACSRRRRSVQPSGRAGAAGGLRHALSRAVARDAAGARRVRAGAGAGARPTERALARIGIALSSGAPHRCDDAASRRCAKRSRRRAGCRCSRRWRADRTNRSSSTT